MDCRSIAPLIALLVSAPAAAQTPDDPPPAAEPTVISGPAEIVDGDTLKISGARIRLFGIDAPEMAEWPWGPRARSALEDLVDGRTVTCLQRDTDRYDRPVATCATAETPDLAEALIAAGHAITYRRFTARTELHGPYMAAERKARDAGLGPAPIHGTEPGFLDFLERFQSGLGALLGLLALSGVAYYNADQARRRDRRLREDDSRAVAAELVGEFSTLRGELRSSAMLVGLHARQYVVNGWGKMSGKRPNLEIYKANYGRMGLLGAQLVAEIAALAAAVNAFWDQGDAGFESLDHIEDWCRLVGIQGDKAEMLVRRLAVAANVDVEILRQQ